MQFEIMQSSHLGSSAYPGHRIKSRWWRWGSASASAPSFSLWLLWLAVYCPLSHRRAWEPSDDLREATVWAFFCSARCGIICQWLIQLWSAWNRRDWVLLVFFVCFFWVQVTIPFLSASGGHPLNSQSVIWVAMSSGAILFKSHFFHFVKTRSRILQILQSLNDFIRRDRNIHFFKSIDGSLQRSAITFRLLDEDLFPIFE